MKGRRTDLPTRRYNEVRLATSTARTAASRAQPARQSRGPRHIAPGERIARSVYWRASIQSRPAYRRGRQLVCRSARPTGDSSFGVDQLHIHPKPVAATLHRTFKNVPNVQLAPDLLHVNGLALEAERRVASDDERAADARQVRGQALGYTINEVILLGIAAGVCEWQHHDGQTRS